MEILLFLLVALFFVTIVGHGLWMFFALIIRSLFGEEGAQPRNEARMSGQREKCAQCGRPLLAGQVRCAGCGRERDGKTVLEEQDLEATTRQLRAFLSAGMLDTQTVQRFEQCIEARRQALLEPRMRPSPCPSVEPVQTPEAAKEKVAPPQPERVAPEDEIPEVLSVSEETTSPPPPAPALEESRLTTPASLSTRSVSAHPVLPPRRSLAEFLAAFIEERNIFWGELVGGLLMVGCSIALVIYLWKDLQRIPYFQFLIFVSTTAAVFGAGLYALHRLKLETTSRGLLLIGALLVPLNFLVMAGLSGQEGEADVLHTVFRVGTEAISLAIFAALLGQAAHLLAPGGRWPLLLAMLGASVSQLIVPRLLQQGEPAPRAVLLLGCLPLAAYIVSASGFLWRMSYRRPLSEEQANAVFSFLGMAVFALMVALGFLVYWNGHLRSSLEILAVLIALAGVPILFGGLLVERGLHLDTEGSQDRAGPRAMIRMAGTAVALCGMVVMLFAVLLAWPQPSALLPVCVLNFAVLTAIAFCNRLPVAHGAALPCLAIGYLVGFHLWAGHLAVPREELPAQLVTWALSAQSGSVLVVLVALLAGVAVLLGRMEQRSHEFYYAAGSGVLSFLSLALVNVRGIDAPGQAAVVTGIYAAGALTLSFRWQSAWVGQLSLVLVVLATLWALWWKESTVTPLWGLAIAAEALLMAMGAVRATLWERGNARTLMSSAWRDAALVAGLLALSLTTWQFMLTPASALHTGAGSLLAATVLLLAWAYRTATFTWMGSASVLATLVHSLVWDDFDLRLTHPLSVAILLHATLVLLGSLSLRRPGQRSEEGEGAGPAFAFSPAAVARLFTKPLHQSALVSSLGALPIMLVEAGREMGSLSGYMAWLSGVWLVSAWTARRQFLFSAFQAALTAALLCGITAWLQKQEWVYLYPEDLADPWSLQAYLFGLGLLSLAWTVARLALRSHAVAQIMLAPVWPAVDLMVLGLVVVAQLGLALWGLGPGLLRELTPVGMALPAAFETPIHAHAYGVGAWDVLGLVAVVLIVALWGRQQLAALLSLVLVAVTVPVLTAGGFEPEKATASALRWGLAVTFLVCSIPLWFRQDLARWASALRCQFDPVRSAVMARWTLVAGTVLPVLTLTAVVLLAGLGGEKLAGPNPDSIFSAIGWTASQVLPLLLLSLGLFGHGVRERSSGYCFSAGLVVNLAVSLIVWHQDAQPPFAHFWVHLVQANVISSAVLSLLWLATVDYFFAEPKQVLLGGPLAVSQIALGLVGNVVLLAGPLGWLVGQPGDPLPAGLAGVGGVGGWLALILASAATFWYADQVAPQNRGHVLGASGLALGILAACSGNPEITSDSWQAYHILTAAWAGTGLIILLAEPVAALRGGELDEFSSLPLLARFLHFSTHDFRVWLNGISLLVLGLALRGTWEDPLRPYWSAGAVLAVSAMVGAVAVRSRRPGYAYASGLLVNLAGGIVWVAWGPATPIDFGYTHVLCFAVASALWSLLGLVLRKWNARLDVRGPYLAFTHVAATAALSLLGVLVGISVVSDLTVGGVEAAGTLAWLALGVTGVALAVSLWDHEARYVLGGVYAAGLLTIGLALHTSQLQPHWLGWTAALALAGYVLLTTVVARTLPGLQELWHLLRLPKETLLWPVSWFAVAQSAVGIVTVGLTVWMCLTFDAARERFAAPLALLLLLGAGIMLVPIAPGRWAIDLRYATLVLGVLVAAEGGWAILDPTGSAVWLHRNVILMVALVLTTLTYGVGLARILFRHGPWAECSRQLGPLLGALASVILLVVLGQEAALYNWDQGRTPMALWAIIIVALALAGLIAAGIAFVLQPERDPFGLKEEGRTLYVYAGELLLVLLFVHFRLTVPELFRLEILARYWTFIVMGIAFLGVGLGEFFSRRGLRVLGGPLERTGVFLPLLPLLSFWVIPLAQVRPLQLAEPAGYGRHAALWFLLGLLYTGVAVSKRSSRFALFAALAGNAGLWSLFFRNDLAFLVHPQMWLIPPALILLVAEHQNRARLSEQQSASLRYVALLMIYVSSTADMFIAGLDRNLFLPLVLAVLAVLGVLCGILLQVRAFLYLGLTFLCLVIFTMIWHAAVGRHQIWVWWTSGIVLGAAIIALFGVFEKRRGRVLQMIEKIKSWD